MFYDNFVEGGVFMNYDLATEMLNKGVIVKGQDTVVRGLSNGLVFKPNSITSDSFTTETETHNNDEKVVNNEVKLKGKNRHGSPCSLDFNNKITFSTLFDKGRVRNSTTSVKINFGEKPNESNHYDADYYISEASITLSDNYVEKYNQIIEDKKLGYCKIEKTENNAYDIKFYDTTALYTYGEIKQIERKMGTPIDESDFEKIGIIPDYEEHIEYEGLDEFISSINKYISDPFETIELIAKKTKEKSEEQSNGYKM